MGEWEIIAQSRPIELKNCNGKVIIPYGKIIRASNGIYRVTHLVMGKTTSKKALSCAHTQKVQIPGSNGARQVWTCVGARDYGTWMLDQKLGLVPNQNFPFCFNFFQLKIRSKTVTTFNFEINQLIIVGFNSKLIIWFNKIVIALPLMPLFPKCHPCSPINKRLLRPSNTQKTIYFFFVLLFFASKNSLLYW